MTLSFSPNPVAFGVVEGREATTVSVTNTSGAPVTVDSIDVARYRAGVLISGRQAPYTLAPGGSETYTLVVTAFGDGTFDETWVFRAGSDAYELRATGTRRIVWPTAHDWTRPFSVRESYRTEIFASESGRETRVSRRAEPRVTLDFGPLVHHETLREFEDYVTGLGANRFIVADPTRYTTLSSDASGTLDLTAAHEWVVQGAFLVLQNGEVQEAVEVDAVSGQAVQPVLALNDASAFPAGSTVRPGFVAHIEGAAGGQRLTTAILRGALTMQVDPGAVATRTSGAAGDTLAGYEIWPFPEDWSQPHKADVVVPFDTADNGDGVLVRELPQRFADKTESTQVTLLSQDAIQAYRQFVRRHRGRQGEFWRSTGRRDFLPAASGHPAGGVRVLGDRLWKAAVDNETLRAVEIRGPSGAEYRLIDAIERVTSNTHITFTTAPTDPPETWDRVSWLQRVRFASDDFTLNYLTDSVARTQPSFKILEAL